MQLMSVSAAARHLGYKSRSQLYKLMNDGWLDAHVHVQMPSGQRILDVDGFQKTLQGIVSGVSTVPSFANAQSAQGHMSRQRVCLVLPAFKSPKLHYFQSSSVGFNLRLSG